MHPIHIFSLLLLSNIAFSSNVIWVNNTQPSEGDGSETAPFKTLSAAFNSVSQSSDLDFQIVLATTDLPYIDANITFASFTPLSLPITAQGSRNSLFLSEDCNKLPLVLLNGQFLFANFTSLEISGIALLFNDTISSKLSVKELKTFKITNSCLFHV